MVSFLSFVSMQFIDRIFLAHYSQEAFHAATNAGTLFLSAHLFWCMLVGIAEVFIAQCNGAGRYRFFGKVTWQALWISSLSIPFFFLFGYVGGTLLVAHHLFTSIERQYLSWNCLFGPLIPFLISLSAFYIGQGKIRMVQILVLCGNIVNLILDPLLIFTFDLGVKGAAIATGMGFLVQLLFLAYAFLRPAYRYHFGTNAWRPSLALARHMVRYGFPSAFLLAFELAGWSLFYWMMKQVSNVHIHVASVIQSIFHLFCFFGGALEKGAAVCTGNLLGGREFHKIPRLLLSGFYLIAGFFAVVFLFCVICPDLLLSCFPSHSQGVLKLISDQKLKMLLKSSMALLSFYLLSEAVRWFFNGMLTAAGDTLYLLISGAILMIGLLLLPTYFFVVKPMQSVVVSFWIWLIHSVGGVVANVVRFKVIRWQDRVFVQPDHLVRVHGGSELI